VTESHASCENTLASLLSSHSRGPDLDRAGRSQHQNHTLIQPKANANLTGSPARPSPAWKHEQFDVLKRPSPPGSRHRGGLVLTM
jgi:hypothetical protein